MKSVHCYSPNTEIYILICSYINKKTHTIKYNPRIIVPFELMSLFGSVLLLTEQGNLSKIYDMLMSISNNTHFSERKKWNYDSQHTENIFFFFIEEVNFLVKREK